MSGLTHRSLRNHPQIATYTIFTRHFVVYKVNHEEGHKHVIYITGYVGYEARCLTFP
jgi:hypothetical protein